MQPPSTISPRLNRRGALSSNEAVSDSTNRARLLPSRDVHEDSLVDAYVQFILYCNPKFDLEVDTEVLRTGFNSPPKSDNREFETWRLFTLIKAFDAKEIKTWGQLALDLGVESPDIGKGQSVQKVQQYTVRLKRWMRAMHIDAFCEYLLGKQHSYFTEVPPVNDPYPTAGRDGVQAEEDLAIRALDPAFRPKRGRRRNSQTEADEEDQGATTPKQPRLQAGLNQAVPTSAYPASAHPNGVNDPWAMASAITPLTYAPWSNGPTGAQTAVATMAPTHLRWQLHDGQQVASPHPMTAHPTSMAAHIEAALENEPKCAITPARRRRKHGPAVSSAWPSANAPGAKPRGRPPASRNVQDGPFSTFPVETSNGILTAQGKAATPGLGASQDSVMQSQTGPRPPIIQRQSEGSGRPGRLSLQVPAHTGGPVRLATPPVPKMLVNGETNDSDGHSSLYTPVVEQNNQNKSTHVPIQRVSQNVQPGTRDIPGFAFEALKRVLTSDLLRANLTGRQQRLAGDEAKRLADSVLYRMGVPRLDTDISRDDIARLTAASWLGLGEQLNVPLGPATGQNKRISVTRFRMDAEGYEEIVSAYDDGGGKAQQSGTREVFDLAWSVSLAGCNGTFELKGLTLAAASGPAEEDAHDYTARQAIIVAKALGSESDSAIKQALQHMAGMKKMMADVGEDGIDWKSRALANEFGSMVARGELERVKSMIVQRVLDVLL
ncbi:hypothetical protein LTR62_007775 [Meristemomyces frigidus]|uniref:ARS binding protein 2 n=1 Tax=Meristemomyces frigidus TaxID=1508187 RepID=A0AAN7TLN4_9PEZI|nr:hypothetical protein LTR62_007775 [Meristemomyces frigidus]